MALGTGLLVVVSVAALASLPWWPYSRQWGYAPSGIFGVALVVIAGLSMFGALSGTSGP